MVSNLSFYRRLHLNILFVSFIVTNLYFFDIELGVGTEGGIELDGWLEGETVTDSTFGEHSWLHVHVLLRVIFLLTIDKLKKLTLLAIRFNFNIFI